MSRQSDDIAMLLDLLTEAYKYVETCADDPAEPDNPAAKLLAKINEAFENVDCD